MEVEGVFFLWVGSSQPTTATLGPGSSIPSPSLGPLDPYSPRKAQPLALLSPTPASPIPF